jgi:excisionase family DNA binding protein
MSHLTYYRRAAMAEMATADRLTYTITEAAQLLGIGRSLAYQAARRGEIKTIRIGDRLLIPRAAIDRLLADEQLFVTASSDGAASK